MKYVPAMADVAARRLLLIGIGPGDPRMITLAAADAVTSADVFFVFDKGAELSDLQAVRDQILARHGAADHRVVALVDPPRRLDGPVYGDAVAGWHDQRAELLQRALLDELAPARTGAILVWGDPSLYDSTLRVADEAIAALPWPVSVEIVPGLSSVALLTARHRIPLNRVGASVRITTGRRLADVPPSADCDVVVMLDGSCAFEALTESPAGAVLDIYWGAYLGTEDEVLIAGPLRDRSAEITARRAELRSSKGWMFDTYLLRWTG
jgi:precorrin-6A synthase